ncbi:MAG: hypothetical protein IPL41_05720 [Micropruina sp.]|nr:hypothetical protein [Micropruina sp.]
MSLLDAPRVSPPQLPPLIASDPGDACDGASFTEAQLAWSGADASTIGAEILDSRVQRLPTDTLHARRLRLAEVEVADPVIVTLNAPRSNWRGVSVSGGSIGVLDCSGSTWRNVVLTDVRIGYLNLREAVLGDVLLTGCRLGTLDAAGASTTRVSLVGCVVEDLDLRNRKGDHLDLRGLDVVRLNKLEGADSLVGATITDQQARWLGPLLATALRITVTEEDQ